MFTQKNKSLIIIVLLLLTLVMPLIGVVGVVLMWFWTKWKMWVKVLVSLPFVFMFMISPVLVYSYLYKIRPFQVFGNSMAPSYKEQQFIMTNVLGKQETLSRGDVLVFISPGSNSEIVFISRIIGLPNEKAVIKEGKVYVNDVALDETEYLDANVVTNSGTSLVEGIEQVIPVNNYLMLSDNRESSIDSREYGFVPRENLVSKIAYCYWNCE